MTAAGQRRNGPAARVAPGAPSPTSAVPER